MCLSMSRSRPSPRHHRHRRVVVMRDIPCLPGYARTLLKIWFLSQTCGHAATRRSASSTCLDLRSGVGGGTTGSCSRFSGPYLWIRCRSRRAGHYVGSPLTAFPCLSSGQHSKHSRHTINAQDHTVGHISEVACTFQAASHRSCRAPSFVELLAPCLVAPINISATAPMLESSRQTLQLRRPARHKRKTKSHVLEPWTKDSPQ